MLRKLAWILFDITANMLVWILPSNTARAGLLHDAVVSIWMVLWQLFRLGLLVFRELRWLKSPGTVSQLSSLRHTNIWAPLGAAIIAFTSSDSSESWRYMNTPLQTHSTPGSSDGTCAKPCLSLPLACMMACSRHSTRGRMWILVCGRRTRMAVKIGVWPLAPCTKGVYPRTALFTFYMINRMRERWDLGRCCVWTTMIFKCWEGHTYGSGHLDTLPLSTPSCNHRAAPCQKIVVFELPFGMPAEKIKHLFDKDTHPTEVIQSHSKNNMPAV